MSRGRSPDPPPVEGGGGGARGQEGHGGHGRRRGGNAAVAGAKPLAKNGYKVRTAHACVKRAILLAAGLPVPNLSPLEAK